jgi:Tol biopolymer transport system component
MAAILEKDPTPISQVKPGTPPALEKVIATCLAKDPAERWQSVRELRHALEWAATPGAGPAASRSRGWWKAAALVAVLVAIGWGVARLRGTGAQNRPKGVVLPITLPADATLVYGIPAVAPDGQSVALAIGFPGRTTSLFVRELDALSVKPVPRTEGAFSPFWSPDSRKIAYWGYSSGLHVANLDNGTVQLVCPDCRSAGLGTDFGASWGTSDVIVFSDVGKLFRVPAGGGEPQALGPLAAGETGRYWPQLLPDGRHFIYLSLAARREDQGVYVGALDSDLRRRIVATQHTAAYSPPGYLVYIRESSLVAQPFDATTLKLSGEAVPILDEEVARMPGTVLAGYAWFSVSTNGVLAWRPAPKDVQQLTWFDRAGRAVGTIGEPTRQGLTDLSADERFAAVCRFESATNRDIWLVDLSNGAGRRLTFDPHDDCGATFSPDGSRIAFFSDRRGVREIYVKPADGSREEELLLGSSDIALNPENWSADGRFLTYNAERPGQSQDLFVLPLTAPGPPSPVPFVATPARETWSTLSPDARFMAYQSNESGGFDVYVREVLASGQPGPGKWQINPRRGFAPVWRPDGREIFYLERRRLMAVAVRTDGPSFTFGAPAPLGLSPEPGMVRFYPTRDGRRFLFAAPLAPPDPVRVLTNWLPKGS